jgi:Ca2+/H+ antiporter
VIDQDNTLQNGQETSAGTDSSFLASGIFNLTDRLQIFSYFVSSNCVSWYRVIMRLFLHTHRELYRYQLTAHEVRDTVRDAFNPDYTFEQCQNDLAALKEWVR